MSQKGAAQKQLRGEPASAPASSSAGRSDQPKAGITAWMMTAFSAKTDAV